MNLSKEEFSEIHEELQELVDERSDGVNPRKK